METDLLAQPAMWDRVACDQRVDSVAAHGEQSCDASHVDDISVRVVTFALAAHVGPATESRAHRCRSPTLLVVSGAHQMVDRTVTIVGAGLVGCVAALFLARRGYRVEIYEGRPDPRRIPPPSGRSVALVLSARGWSAFAALEIEASIQKLGTELHGRVVHDRAGKLAFHRYGEAGQSIFCVSRTALNAAFLDALDQHAHVGMHFGERLVGVDTKASTLRFQTRDGAEHAVPLGERVLAADGAFSTVRSSYQRTDLFDYSQQYGTYGYKEFTLPPRGGAPVFEANATHVWPRGQSMLTAFPLLDGSFTCTLVMPFQGQQSFASLGNTRDVLDLFEREFPDALVHMPELAHEFAANPTASFVSIRCYPWVHGGVALIGDAAHAMVPFFGQGMNAGFEDAQVLDACLARHDDDWRAALADYQSARKPNCDAVTDLSLLHFSELSDRVADPRFILQKRLEQKIHRMHSDKFVPLYSRVAFTTTPYVEALEARQRQQALIDKLIALPNIESDWDSPAVETAIHRLVLEL